MGARDFDKDFYKTLGVSKDADAATIKKAYRKLAREYHPDANTGDKAAEERFKEISEAYDTLSDPKSRSEYDEGRKLFANGGFPRGGYPNGGPNMGGQNINFDINDLFGNGADLGDIFGGMFGQRGPRRGQDLAAEVEISFVEAVNGTTVTFSLQGQGNVSARIPAGVNDGARIRLKGKGGQGPNGNNGDLIVTVKVRPDAIFGRKDQNLTITVPVTFVEAVMGADIEVPTLDGSVVKVRIPAGTANGRTFRVKDRGVPLSGKNGKGDLLVTVEIAVPQKLDSKEKEALEKFAAVSAHHNPRETLVAKVKR